MAGLLYREDADEVRARLKHWWEGGDLGRPVMKVVAPRETPVLDIPPREAPEGWITRYSMRDFDYRVHLAQVECNHTHYLGEALPTVSPDLGPGCLAGYLGCAVEDQKDTAWFHPCAPTREAIDLDLDPENDCWRFTLRLAEAMLNYGEGKFLLEFPDMLGGLDTLAAMRGPEELMMDMLEAPEWVNACVERITENFFACYDPLYELMRDESGGSNWWIWAPGRMAKFQCDFSAMIGPDAFAEFMVPALREMCRRTDHNLYHWDGPGAIPHLDHLLDIEEIEMIQWVPGAGNPLPDAPDWWPYYHRMLDAGKKVFIHTCTSADSLRALRREFGPKLSDFYIIMTAPSKLEGEALLKLAEG